MTSEQFYPQIFDNCWPERVFPQVNELGEDLENLCSGGSVQDMNPRSRGFLNGALRIRDMGYTRHRLLENFWLWTGSNIAAHHFCDFSSKKVKLILSKIFGVDRNRIRCAKPKLWGDVQKVAMSVLFYSIINGCLT